jgi:ABC-type glycerol-3-phosphate transport system substrate-binding protein
MYMLGDVPKDLDEVLAKANAEYFQPMLNTTLKMVFLAWSDYQTKYPLVLAAGEDVDIMFTAPWAFYEQESGKGSFTELTTDFIARWMPTINKEQSAISWSQAKTGGKVYGIPTTQSGSVYKYVGIREDLRTKYNLPAINSWDTLEQFLFTVAANEPSIQAYAAQAEAPEVLWVYLESRNVLYSGDPIYYIWNNRSLNEPTAQELSFMYTSDMFRDFALEMAEWASNGVWSRNVMNNTVSQGDSFAQGKSASVFWNSTVFSLGKTMEEQNGVGKAGYYEASPTVPTRKETYDNNMWAIASSSKNQGRAALALDLMKTHVPLTILLQSGVAGRHYISQGGNQFSPGPEAADYANNAWGWALNRPETLQESYDTSKYAQRYALETSITARNFEPKIDGFRFDRKNINNEWAVISALIEEYTPSFECGVYGAQTQAKFNEFKGKVEAAGLAKLTSEFQTQYAAFLRSN